DSEQAPPVDDMVLPFQVERTGVRGRLVRLGDVVDTILTRHAYPDAVAKILGEALTLTAALSAVLKDNGSLTLQTSTDGPLGMIVVTYHSDGGLRGFAQLDRARYRKLKGAAAESFRTLIGEGHLAMTIDPGGGAHRYQGIVAVEGESLTDCAHAYFQQSEQIATEIRIAVAPLYVRGADGGSVRKWRAGGIMIQHLAVSGGRVDEEEREAREKAAQHVAPTLTVAGEPVEQAWERAAVLMATARDDELLDPGYDPERLLYSLYHEDGVRVFHRLAMGVDCRCSRERIRHVLSRFEREEYADMLEEGLLKVRCEFCNRTFEFDPDDIPCPENGKG
ncbi:MAG: Hsp33 family molecular chaperone, partial [Alphaproteobacteria bacterium]